MCCASRNLPNEEGGCRIRKRGKGGLECAPVHRRRRPAYRARRLGMADRRHKMLHRAVVISLAVQVLGVFQVDLAENRRLEALARGERQGRGVERLAKETLELRAQWVLLER